MGAPRRRFGDRRDGTLIRDLDSMHIIMPLIYPSRCDNEAYISERIDLGPIQAWMDQKNQEQTDFPYTMFHIVVASLLKVLTLRPKLNRFIANKNMYQRSAISAAFVVKKHFRDDGAEGLAFVYAEESDTIATIHDKIRSQVQDCRDETKIDSSSQSMDDIIRVVPRPLLKAFIGLLRVLDRHGTVPRSFIATDPYYSSVVLSNIGSIRLKCGYHHLTNWGTNSVFCLIGEIKNTPSFREDGTFSMRRTVDLGLTIDERLADGYYYSKSIRLLKQILEHPELLERPLTEKVEIA